MLREIVVDTETTGLDPVKGDRVVEIACLELHNHLPTGKSFQCYLNPKRDMPAEAFAVHGLSAEFLADKPEFSAVAQEMLAFLGDDQLIIHNAEFDLKFLNFELKAVGAPLLPYTRVVDTLSLARRKFPGSPASLDALCKRFEIDTGHRVKHGALLDAELLAKVYIELIGGRQPGFELAATVTTTVAVTAARLQRPVRPPRPHEPLPGELAAHEAFIATIKEAVWLK